MKKVLEDLFFGEIQPNVSKCEDNQEIERCSQIITEHEKTLLKLLKGKERNLFLDLINAQREFDGTVAAETFISGFKLGARIIVESIVEV